MPSDRSASDIFVQVVEAWISMEKEEIRMETEGEPLFRPLITWPEGTEYLQKVQLPEEEPLESRVFKQIIEVFSIYDLEPCHDAIRDLVAVVVKMKSQS